MAKKRGAPEPAIFDDGVVCAVRSYGDTDVIAHLFLRDAGRVSAFARAAKNSRKRFGAGLMPLVQGRVGLRPRRGAQLWALESIEVRKDPLGLSQDPVSYGRAAYVVELLERLMGEGDANAKLFDDLVLVLDELAAGRGRAELLRAYELRLLGYTGYLPDLVLDAPVVGLDRPTGQLLTDFAPGCIPFDDEAREATILLAGAKLDALPSIETPVLKRVGRLFAGHLRRQGGAPLKSIAFLRGIS